MNRLYVVESTFTMTGAVADHRAGENGLRVTRSGSIWRRHLPDCHRKAAQPARVVAGRGTLSPGCHGGRAQPSWKETWCLPAKCNLRKCTRLAHVINEQLGNVGATVKYVQPVEAEPQDQGQSLRDLAGAMQRGDVDVLLILRHECGVFTAPG